MIFHIVFFFHDIFLTKNENLKYGFFIHPFLSFYFSLTFFVCKIEILENFLKYVFNSHRNYQN